MKKARKIIITVILIGLVSIPISQYLNMNSGKVNLKFISNYGHSSTEYSNEKIYKEILMTILNPYIQNAIDSFYYDYLTSTPTEDPWNTKILSISNPEGQNYTFIIELEIMPYIGPHNSVGRDHITLQIKIGEEPEVINYKHIESYPIAPNYEDIIIQWPPK